MGRYVFLFIMIKKNIVSKVTHLTGLMKGGLLCVLYLGLDMPSVNFNTNPVENTNGGDFLKSSLKCSHFKL